MLYRQLLNDDFDRLPRSLREFHSVAGGGRASGMVNVSHRRSWLARMVGFPPPGDRIPLELQVIERIDGETWIRRFGDFTLETKQCRQGDLLLETMGPVEVQFRVTADDAGMRFESQGARWRIIPLPMRIRAEVRANESSWTFHVSVAHVGSYHGAVTPVP